MQYQYRSLRAVTGKECTLKKSALHMQGSCFAYYCFFHVIVTIVVIESYGLLLNYLFVLLAR